MLRGNYAAKIDDKGRLKIPNAFRALVQGKHGNESFVTSLTGEYVRLYPLPVWLALEEKLAAVPTTLPARLKFFDRVNYFGQMTEIDAQGRVVIDPRLRDSAGMSGEVDVFGQYDHLDIWNHERFVARMQREPYTDDDAKALAEFWDLTAMAHEPVMVPDVVALLAPERGGTFVDCTVGLGGHSRALLDAGVTRLIGLDRDRLALALAAQALAGWSGRVELVHADYRDLDRVLDERGIDGVDGALADLGVSSLQLDAEGRGFSFRRDEPLDMRMDQSQGATVADLLRDVPEEELANLIFQYGEERYSRRIARAIVGARAAAPIETTGQLAAIVRRAVPRRGYPRLDPATRTFQALRIRINRELDGLEGFLAAAARRLLRGARLAVISFHSLEDRVVKHAFRAFAAGGEARILTKRPLVPADEEVARNPRARSAKLRAIERFA